MDAENQSEDAAGDEQETALLPSSLFGGDCKVGDTYTVKVVAKYDDELEVEPVSEKSKGKSESKDYGMKDAEMEMDNMAGPGGPASNEA